jgi:eukaryotic-like serine/threonine-protein kinase
MIGRVFMGRYQIIQLLGEGGMGKVFFAFDLRAKREVVIKVLHESIARQAAFRERFQQEMDFMARFQHPNVVALYDSSSTDANGPCIVMEYIQGQTLDTVLRKEKPLAPLRTGMLLAHVCKALHAAHQAGVLHRDVKPANLMVVDAGQPTENLKVLDFGLSSLATALYIPKERLRNPREYFSACGTPDYMCPEQVRGDELDHRSDLYSVGIVLYEMLTGRQPFTRGSNEKTMLAQEQATAPAFAQLGIRNVPPAVEAVVMHTLAKYPVERPASARILSELFEKALGVKLTKPEDWEESRPPPVRSPAGSSGTHLRAHDPSAVVHVMEAWMPERIAVVKLQGFVEDLGGEVVDSVPGRIRVQLRERQEQGFVSKLGLGVKRTVLRPLIDLELQMEKREVGHLSKLHITATYKPPGGRTQAMMPGWRQKCDQVHRDLQAYLMGRG